MTNEINTYNAHQSQEAIDAKTLFSAQLNENLERRVRQEEEKEELSAEQVSAVNRVCSKIVELVYDDDEQKRGDNTKALLRSWSFCTGDADEMMEKNYFDSDDYRFGAIEIFKDIFEENMRKAIPVKGKSPIEWKFARVVIGAIKSNKLASVNVSGKHRSK
jgi:hypothetical protein